MNAGWGGGLANPSCRRSVPWGTMVGFGTIEDVSHGGFHGTPTTFMYFHVVFMWFSIGRPVEMPDLGLYQFLLSLRDAGPN